MTIIKRIIRQSLEHDFKLFWGEAPEGTLKYQKGKDTLAFIRTSFTKLIKDLIAREKGSKYEPKVYMEDAGFNRAKDQTIAMLKSLIE